jgi:3-oxoacyl-[acyl-carrier protein] reductase
MRLKDKVAIITGGGQGIGKVYAKRFLQEGAKVAIADIDSVTGKETTEELSELGETVFVEVDVSDEASAERMARDVDGTWGRIDVLVNNAAIYSGLKNSDSSYEYLQRIMSVNMFGVWIASKAVAPFMIKQHRGSIINQSSVGSFMYNTPGRPEVEELPSFHYSWSKWGVVGLSRFMAGALGPSGIRVNCICPGSVMTDATVGILLSAMGSEEASRAYVESTKMNAPLRVGGLEPEDLCGTCLFFASDDSALVTGQTLAVDGGLFMI